jgi:hypothetical protein
MIETVQAICEAKGWSHTNGQVQVAIEGGRTQTVSVEQVREGGDEFVRLASVIGPSATLDLRRTTAALRLNANLRVGAFAIIGEQFAVVDSISLADADRETLEHAMAFLAKTADRYEQVVYGTDEN